MVLGAMLVFAALSLFLWNQWEARQAEVSTAVILPQVIEQIEAEPVQPEPCDPEPDDPVMASVEIDGRGYIGYLSLPALDLELPVMDDWNYPRLKIAPCRYAGSVRTNNLVIAAHNYERHFGNISSLAPGDAVYFTDMNGVVWTYEVAELDVLAPTAVEEMTSEGYDLTLFTCTYGGKSRITVRCRQVEDGSVKENPCE